MKPEQASARISVVGELSLLGFKDLGSEGSGCLHPKQGERKATFGGGSPCFCVHVQWRWFL